MDIRFILSKGETDVTPIKIAEALISQSNLSVEELDEVSHHLEIYARFDRRKRMANRREEEDF